MTALYYPSLLSGYDIFDIKGKKSKQILDLTFDEALTYADVDINNN